MIARVARGKGSPQVYLYDQQFQQRIFRTLSQGCGRTSSLVSLGLSDTLRARMVQRMHLAPGMAVCDLMTGGGEIWPGCALSSAGPPDARRPAGPTDTRWCRRRGRSRP